MQLVVKDAVSNQDAMGFEEFVWHYPAQVALLGIQLMWTRDCDLALRNYAKVRTMAGVAMSTDLAPAPVAEMMRKHFTEFPSGPQLTWASSSGNACMTKHHYERFLRDATPTPSSATTQPSTVTYRIP